MPMRSVLGLRRFELRLTASVRGVPVACREPDAESIGDGLFEEVIEFGLLHDDVSTILVAQGSHLGEVTPGRRTGCLGARSVFGDR